MSQTSIVNRSFTLGKSPVSDPDPPRPRAKCRKGLNAMSDVAVWGHSDGEILFAIQETWRSDAYKHYKLFLERHPTPSGDPDRLVLRFECKYGSLTHAHQYRERLRSSDGTQNLLTSAKVCDRHRGLIDDSPVEPNTLSEYSEAKHRAILAIRCARDRRSFESVVDNLHRREVELLRPGTVLPSSATVSNDVKVIYADASSDAARYLQQIPGALHLAVDGWTSPTSESYLGIVVFWQENNKIWRTILEFVRLTEAHTGAYMANRIYDCLTRYGIDKKIMSICLDNAAANGTLVAQLHSLMPTFRGAKSRVRCFAHIINLMAKAFMSMFSVPPRRRKPAQGTNSPAYEDTDDIEPDPDDSTKDLDPDKLEHDDTVVEGMGVKARAMMAAKNVVVSESALASARKIMFKVAALARRVNDSATLGALFGELVDKDPELKGDQRALTRRVATRWNTDRASLNSHLHFKGPVQWLTGSTKHNLKRYALDDEQWSLAAELNNVLEVFQEPTDRFSKAEVPLIHDTIPEFLTLKYRLEDIRDDIVKAGLHPITRVAAQAALLVYDKYMSVMEVSDIYDVAVAMSPDRKLKWFSDREVQTDKIRQRVLDRFYETYAHISEDKAHIFRTESKGVNVWTARHSSAPAGLVAYAEADTIESYLNSPVLSHEIITQHGGILAYWVSQLEHRPRVARMALDYLTTPASSVDAERAFSGGRLMISHLQHQMSSRTFQAQMAIGSWFETPLMPSLEDVSAIISSHM